VVARNENYRSISDHVAAVPANMADYGLATTVDSVVPSYGVASLEPSLGLQLRFYIGELSGLLFVGLTTLFIMAVPASLTRSGMLSGLMRRIFKRTLDILGASVGIILTAPLMALVALAVKLDSRGPVFYSQTRVGINRRRGGRRLAAMTNTADRRARDRRREDLHGLPFSILKFRTMVVDAEKHSGPVWATTNDPRITRIGRFLRKTRLDEIPQFFSVLKGDMSLVGPRPERPKFVADLSTQVDNYTRRLEVKPGITGLAQVENGYDSSLASVNRKVQYDLQYIRSWSVLSDLRILAKTVVVVITGKGAC
jgi:lipopolysaccharide/colanic/teichoic acid biosynthesis glycosyltransferase